MSVGVREEGERGRERMCVIFIEVWAAEESAQIHIRTYAKVKHVPIFIQKAITFRRKETYISQPRNGLA